MSAPLLVGRRSTGARGAGKTVMLNAVEERARQLGWLVVSETATAGFLARITGQHLLRLLREFDPHTVQRRFSAVTGPANPGGVSWTTVEATSSRPAYAPNSSCSPTFLPAIAPGC